MSKIAFVTLGCPKNLVDSEIYLFTLKSLNHELVEDINEAEIVFVNTCTFISSATSESIENILEIAELKNKNLKKLVVTGCMAQRFKEEIFKEIPEVDYVIGTGDIHKVKEIFNNQNHTCYTNNINSNDAFINKRIYQTPLSYTYLRIAEGCNNACSYCIIPKLRGRYRSRMIDDILVELNGLIDYGYKEINLIAEDVTRYGIDLGLNLVSLLKEIEKIDKEFNIRLLYCYPEKITDELIDFVSKSKKVYPYFDMPIQHISNRILDKMNRNTTKENIENLIIKIKNKIPNVVLRTSLIVGFPGETEEDFKLLKDFVEKKYFYHLGVFTYSKEDGTKAAKMEDQIDEELKQERQEILMEIQKKFVIEKNESFIGEKISVVVDDIADDGLFLRARANFQAPEIDTCTYILGLKELSIGDKVDVVIKNIDEYDLIGEIEDEFTE